MQIIKYVMLFFILIATNLIGRTISQKYQFRLMELEEMKQALNTLKTKMKFTYAPIGEIFEEIAVQTTKTNIANVFQRAKQALETKCASEAWQYALENTQTNMKQEDLESLKNLSKSLGASDIEGQISQIEITENFIEMQLKEAKKEQQKNEKLYQKLGTIIGLGIVVILI